MSERPPITPDTKVAALLADYPELEEVLIAIAPLFQKLRNPILRHSVAMVASLRQAAAIGKVDVEEVVNKLRAEVGQALISGGVSSDAASYFSSPPEWFHRDKVVASLEERDVDPDVMPLRPLLLQATEMAEGEILELVTACLPAPAIEIMKNKGFSAWSVNDGEQVKTYFSKLAKREHSLAAKPGRCRPSDDPSDLDSAYTRSAPP